MKQNYKSALILGLGVSGQSAAELLLQEGSEVTCLDASAPVSSHSLSEKGADIVINATEIPKKPFDICIVSPGIAYNSEWLSEIRQRNICCISELELGWSRLPGGKILAITGTNGKSTAVKLCNEVLAQSGFSSVITGNYGDPLCSAIQHHSDIDIWVVEVSSYQLETTINFKPNIGILLNLYPSHLGRHKTMDIYTATKAKLFKNATPEDLCIVPYNHLLNLQNLANNNGKWITFGDNPEADFSFQSNKVYHNSHILADFKNTCYGNAVMGPTAAAITCALTEYGATPDIITKAALHLESLPHRMQEVGEINGVRFINDSKATNIGAMKAAIQLANAPVRLIAGGIAQAKDFNSAKDLLFDRVRCVYLIGKNSDDMALAWSDVVSCVRCNTLQDAVKHAWRDASTGEVILLSPGCASFDGYRSFSERGEDFGLTVQKLAKENNK